MQSFFSFERLGPKMGCQLAPSIIFCKQTKNKAEIQFAPLYCIHFKLFPFRIPQFASFAPDLMPSLHLFVSIWGLGCVQFAPSLCLVCFWLLPVCALRIHIHVYIIVHLETCLLTVHSSLHPLQFILKQTWAYLTSSINIPINLVCAHLRSVSLVILCLFVPTQQLAPCMVFQFALFNVQFAPT